MISLPMSYMLHKVGQTLIVLTVLSIYHHMVAHTQNITLTFSSRTGLRQRVLWNGVIIGIILFYIEKCKILSTHSFHRTWIRYRIFPIR